MSGRDWAAAAALAVPGGGGRRLLDFIGRWELLWLCAILPWLWFPRPWSIVLLGAIPLLWLVRWVRHGALSVRTVYDGPFLVLILLLPLTLVPVTDWAVAAPRLYALLAGIALVYALANAATTREGVRTASAAALLLWGACVFLVGLVGTEWVAKVVTLGPVYERLPALVSGVVSGTVRGGINANETGGALALLIPALLGLWWSRLQRGRAAGPRWLTAATGALALAMMALLGLTQSRSALAGCLVGIVALVAFGALAWPRASGLARWPRALAAAALALLALGALVAAALFGLSGASLPSGPLGAVATRLEIWSRAWDMLQDFPYTGIGFGQFPVLVKTLYPVYSVEATVDVPHAHNMYLQWALDLGIPGAVAMACVVVAFFRAMVRRGADPADAEGRALAAGLAAGMAAYLVYGLTDAITLGARGGLGFWLVLGLGAALANLPPASGSAPEPALVSPGPQRPAARMPGRVAGSPPG